ncbi:hypothetical protein INT46_008466 [Mucor plumbeus]|uniref:Uncharacterized protein n=1 Tax=Mucor plumbeus TaxID=97098 RepID=A0A8H7QGN9_9FUNG|nr:hypothetical protein INT46_008466 [Mucor plumbeus]
MDNNPFRSQQSQTGNYMTPNYGGQSQPQPQPQQPQQPQQQQPYHSNNMGGGYSSTPIITTPQNGYQQEQPQQQTWQYQQPQNNMMSPPAPQQNSFTSTLPQQNSFSSTLPSSTAISHPSQQYSPYTPNASLMSSTTSNVNTPPQMNNFGAGGNTYQPYSMPTPNTSNYPNNNNMMYNNTGYQQPYQQQQNNPSNFYIPPNFGMSTTTPSNNISNSNNNMFQQQSRHAPVDASSLLKGTQVRRVECPVCQKMIEGDDMAVNHHVNEHYT